MSKLILEQEAELLQGLKQGDEAAFEKIFRFYHKPLRYFAYGFLKDEDEAEDTIQQLFVAIWERRKDLLIGSSLKSYLFTAVKNACLKKISKSSRTELLDWEEENESAGIESTLQKVQEKDLSRAIDKAIQDLPDRCRLVFRLSRFGNMTYQEIANELELSVKTVENQISKALSILRVTLKDHVVALLIVLGNIF